MAGKEKVEWSNGRTPLPVEYFTGTWDVTNHARAPRWREPSQTVVCKISFKKGFDHSTIRPFQEEKEGSEGARENPMSGKDGDGSEGGEGIADGECDEDAQGMS